MTNDAVDSARHQRVPPLDRHQPAEAMAEHEYRPDAQRAARGEEHDAEPAHGISIDRPEFDPVGIGRQIGHQQPDHPERREHPAVAAILALAGAEISAAEQRYDAEDDEQ